MENFKDHKNTTEFMYALEKLEMSKGSGLVFVHDQNGFSATNPSERIAVELAGKYGATAVYFRRFTNGNRSSVPQIYVYDYTNKMENEEEIAELHKNLWNAAIVPLFFVFTRTAVKIFNCHKQPDFDKKTEQTQYTIFEKIKLAADVSEGIDKNRKLFRDFSGKKFDNGSFWEIPKFKNDFQLDHSVYGKLLKQLKEAKREIVNRKILPKSIAQKLFVMTILIKYLEERIDEDRNTVFPPDFFEQFATNAISFVDVLRTKGACMHLFDFLSNHFNGKIFEWNNMEERETLKEADLTSYADFLEGKLAGAQYVLWPIYSFNDLPIELISNIYEDFLEGQPGVVYTPPYLVNLLIDETIPYDDMRSNFKVLDPACGSGIFLVAAFRRIVDNWRINNNWHKPDLKTLKKLLTENIFGVDCDQEAIRLTAFSLSLALCDMLSPKVIWEELKFDNLFKENLLCSDFFALIEKNVFVQKFDLVIGNPPFNSELNTVAAVEIELFRQKVRPEVPFKQIALLFLDQSINLCHENGILCLILPSGPFLYNENSGDFRKYFLSKYCVPQIIDFTALNSVLFESANVGAIAVFVKRQPNNIKELFHITVRRTKAVKEKLYFEIDHYDFHRVSHQEALDNRLIWKANLLGGGRLKYLVGRLSSMRSFGEFLEDKVKHFGWHVGEGYKPGDKESRLKELKHKEDILDENSLKELRRLEKDYEKADFLTGKSTIDAVKLTDQGINPQDTYLLKKEYFLRPRVKAIYEGPHVLIRELAGKDTIPIAFWEDYLTFPAQIIGITAPEDQRKELLEIVQRIKDNRLYLFYLAASSGRYMVSKSSSVLKADIDKLPYPEDKEAVSISDIDKILINDALDYLIDYHRKGENSLIAQEVDVDDLIKFAEVYCDVMNSVYQNLQPSKPVITDSFVCYPFYFKEEPITSFEVDSIEIHLNKLLVQEYESANLRLIRVARIYDKNVIYLVKPKQKRFWLQSIAIRDADETFLDLIGQGY